MTVGSLTAFTGPIGVGKTTLARKLCSDRARIGETCLILSFATPIREMLASLVGDEYVFENDLKNDPIDWLDGKTPRQLLQSLGTSWGRELIHPEIWVNATKRLIMDIRMARPESHIYIDDLRFDNEALMVQSLKGRTVYLNRSGVMTTDAHKSEKGITTSLIDEVIDLPSHG